MNVTVDKSARTQVPILSYIAERWSPRAFQEKPVEREKIIALLEAARWAPSSRNFQPWRFILATRSEPEGYQRLLGCLSERNQRWAQHAPVLLLVAAEVEIDGSPNRTALYDTGLAVGTLTVQATASGLALRQMGGFDRDRARAVFQIPAHCEPVCVLAIGYRGDPGLLPDDLREGELAPRARRSLGEIVFSRIWGHAASMVNGKSQQG
jgi:nitroreductase